MCQDQGLCLPLSSLLCTLLLPGLRCPSAPAAGRDKDCGFLVGSRGMEHRVGFLSPLPLFWNSSVVSCFIYYCSVYTCVGRMVISAKKKSENHRTRQTPSSFEKSILGAEECPSQCTCVNWHYLANCPHQVSFHHSAPGHPKEKWQCPYVREGFHILGSGFYSSSSACRPAVMKYSPFLVMISGTPGCVTGKE